jgi:hypothetical protein
VASGARTGRAIEQPTSMKMMCPTMHSAVAEGGVAAACAAAGTGSAASAVTTVAPGARTAHAIEQPTSFPMK